MSFSLQVLENDLTRIVRGAQKHAPEILTALGITGFVTTVVLAVDATPKALKAIEEEHPEGATKVEAVKSAAKYYIPAGLTGIASTACIIGANRVSARRNAALTAAYTLATEFAKDYKDAVIEQIGEEKEKDVEKRVAEKRMERNPIKDNVIIQTPERGAKFYDPYNDRYFESNVHKLNGALNQLNNMLMNELWANMSDFFYAAGLPETRSSDLLGWKYDEDGLISLRYTPVTFVNPETDEQEAVLQFEFSKEPRTYTEMYS